MAPPLETPSNNLWVGNLSAGVCEADLSAAFQKFGPLDSVTSYATRGFGFLYFKDIDDAIRAKEALQGSIFSGSPIRIEFAKPAKPCKSLWVAGISKAISKDELEDQFKEFGKIQEFKFLRERNTAYVDYAALGEAAEALKNMNGKKVGGEKLRVDYLRSQPARREQGPEFREMRDGQHPSRSVGHPDTRLMPPDFGRNYSDPMHAGAKRQYPFQLPGQRADGQPSKVLLISYPPSVHVDEDMLHNAMILFGEIEGIKTFYDRNYSLVEFRSVEEAKRAKEGLQGKLFNDPRITIEYSSSGRDFLEYHPSIMGPPPDFFPNDNPFQAAAPMGMLGHNRPILPPYGIHGPDLPARQGRFDPVISGAEFVGSPVLRKLRDTSPHAAVGAPNWKQSSPTPGMLSSPSGEQKPPSSRNAPGGWDVFDSSQLQRETKRSRIDGVLPYDPKRRDQQYGLGPVGPSGGPRAVTQTMNNVSPLRTTTAPGVFGRRHSGHDYIWRGIISKGGTPVCHARCVSMGERIESEIPEVVNCSARTGLDMLTKHYADAVGFRVVYFLPDSEEDFASYTEFLRYLGSKDRAGVAKFADGTTLFLVPPSDFLTKVLNVEGPERLYGVVLKFAHQIPGGTPSLPPEPNQPPPQYVKAPQLTSSQATYDAMLPRMNYIPPVTRGEDLKLPLKEVGSVTALYPTNPVQHSNTAVAYPASASNTTVAYPASAVQPSSSAAPAQTTGVTLTPELIATLAKILPATNKLSSVERAGDVAVAPGELQQQPWRYEQQPPAQPADHMAQQFNNNQTQVYSQQLQPNSTNHYSQGPSGFSQMQEQHSFNFQGQGRPSQTVISQPTQLSAQPHMLGMHHDAANGAGIAHGSDSLGLYGSSVPQQPTNIHGTNVSQPQTVASGMGHGFPSALYGQVQEGSEPEVGKDECYKNTLLLAASLLNQIQQKKQNSQGGQGSGNH